MTERRRAHSDARLDFRLAALLDAISDAALCLDAQGHIIGRNAPATELLCRGAGSLDGAPVSEVLPCLRLPAHAADRSGTHAEPAAEWQQVRARAAQGGELPLQARVLPCGSDPEAPLVLLLRRTPSDDPDHEVLSSTEVQLAKAQRIAHLGSWEWLIGGGGLAWSDETYRIFGLEPQSTTPTYEAFLAAVHPDDRARIERDVQATLNDDAPYDCEHRVVRPDGSERIVRERGELVRDAAGAPVRMLGTVLDITEQRKAERELTASQERLSAILDLAADAIITVDDQQRIATFNRGAESMFGYSAEEVLGQPMELLIPERFRSHHGEHVRQFASNGQAARRMGERADIYALRRDGKEFAAEASISTLELHGAQLHTVIVRDVTERKRAEQELNASKERYRRLVEGSMQGILIHRRFTPLFVNPACARLMGYESPEAILALGDLRPLLDPRDVEALGTDPNPRRSRGDGESVRRQFTALHRDGTRIRLEALSHPVEWQGRMATQTVVLDITERERLEAQLRQAQKMEAVGQLAGGVAHDFNNLLQVVRGYVELSMHHSGDPARLETYLKQILGTTDGGSHLVRQLLAFSRRDVLRTQAVDLNVLVQNLMEMLRRLIPANIELEFAPVHPAPQVLADRSAMEQALINLCVNARDAMPEGGRLTIRTGLVYANSVFRATHSWARPGIYAAITVEDTGTGIAEDVLPHVFEPFFTTKAPGKGTGLGLSMVYGSICQQEGMVEVESAVGKGTSFQVYLPLEGSAPVPEAPSPVEEAVPGGAETILVAEDNPDVLHLLRELLELQGYRVLEARNGTEAVALFERERSAVDLVLLDIVLPGLDGRAVAERIRAMDARVPVLFSTGYSTAGVDARFLAAEAVRIIQKPFRPDDLLRAVRTHLDGANGD